MDGRKDEIMTFKLLGSACILLVCGGFGYHLAWHYQREISMLQKLCHVIAYMESVLQYSPIPLPLLCGRCATETNGILSAIFSQLSEKMDSQEFSDVKCCMTTVLKDKKELPDSVVDLLTLLGRQLGNFDLDGQVKSLRDVKEICGRLITQLAEDKGIRIRRYKTLGLCVGAALVIVFI